MKRLPGRALVLLCGLVLAAGQPAAEHIATLVAAEATIDEQAPVSGLELRGWGDGALVLLEATGAVDLGGLESGAHGLSIRFQDDAGTWSAPLVQGFGLADRDGGSAGENDLVGQAEAFFDSDPGPGNGLPLSLDGSLDINGGLDALAGQLDVSGLAPGPHTLYVRVANQAGFWSVPIAQGFHVRESGGGRSAGSEYGTAEAEAFFDQDPGEGNGIPLSLDGRIPFNTALQRAAGTLDVRGLEPGAHTLYLRVRDAAGFWSIPIPSGFYLPVDKRTGPGTSQGPAPIVAADYAIDGAPYRPAPAADGAFGGLVELVDLAHPVDTGVGHRVDVRFHDSVGRVSSQTLPEAQDSDDIDRDGLSDSWERRWFGNLDQDSGDDPDGDGSTNLEEQEGGTNPTVPDPVTDVVETASFTPAFGNLDGKQVGGDLVLDYCYRRTGDDQGFTVDDQYDTVYLVRDQQVVAMRTIPDGGYYDFCAGSTLWKTPMGNVVSSWAEAFGGAGTADFRLVVQRRDGRLRGSAPVTLSLQDELQVAVSSDTDFPASGPDLDVTFQAVQVQGGTPPYSYDWSYVYDWDPEITSREALGSTVTVVARLGLEPFPGRFWGWGAVPVNLAVSDDAGRITHVQTIAVVDRQSRVGNPNRNGSASRLVDGVDVVSGNLHHAVTDLIVKGRGPDFRLARSYNSGRGGEWQLNYDLTLRLTGANGDREARVRREDGRDQTFFQGNDGDWYPVDIGSFDRLIEQPDGSFDLYTKGQTVYRFVDGRLDRISDRQGRALSMLRDAQGRLEAVLDALGRRYDFSYDGSGNLIRVRDFTGRAVDYGYDANGMLASVTNPRDAAHPELGVVRYHYLPVDPGHDESATYLERIVDARGNTTKTIEYAEEWGENVFGDPVLLGLRVSRTTDALGGETLFQYDESDVPDQGIDLTVVVPPVASDAVAFALDVGGRVLRKVEAHGNQDFEREVHRAYQDVTDPRRIGEKGIAATLTNARGYETQKVYSADGRGNLASIRDAEDRTTSIDWESLGTGSEPTKLDVPTQVTTAGGSVYDLAYTDHGLVETLTDPRNAEIRMSYSGGELAAVTDARGNTTGYAHDAAGNVLSVTDALGNLVRNSYDSLGREVARTDARGAVTRYSYDLHGNLLSVKDALDEVTRYEYDGNDNRVRQADAKGHVTEYVYDAKNRRIETRWSVGGVAYSRLYGYDDMDRVVEITDANGRADATGYDPLGRVSTETDALGQITRFEYDANGNTTRVTDPEGRSVRTQYDALDRRVREEDDEGNVETWDYDAEGRVSEHRDARGNITRFGYDAAGNLVEAMDAEGGLTRAGYDANGNKTSVTDPNGNVTRYGYDALDRLVSIELPGGQTWLMEHDANGNEVRKLTPNGERIEREYDPLDRVSRLREHKADGTLVRDQSYTYDANGNRETVTDASGTIHYSHDERDRLAGVTDVFGQTLGYAYDGVGNLTEVLYPGAKHVRYGYDAADRLATVTDWLGAVTEYTRDASGRITRVDNGNGTYSEREYDQAGRLTLLRDHTPTGAIIASHDLTLDEAGNIVRAEVDLPLEPALTVGARPMTYDENNRLLEAGEATFVHDPSGRIVEHRADGGVTEYRFDARDLITSVLDDGQVTAEYRYDANGDRISRALNGNETRFVLDTNRRLPEIIAETDALGAVSNYYVYGEGLISQIGAGGEARYYHFDPTGHTVALTDGSGVVTDRYADLPYGETAAQGTGNNPFRFVGKHGVMDDGNGLHYMRARYYSEKNRRFFSVDPVHGDVINPQSLHRYAYSLGNPVAYTDPSGLSVTGGVLKIAIGAAVITATIIGAPVVLGTGAVAATFGGLAIITGVAGGAAGIGGGIAELTATATIDDERQLDDAISSINSAMYMSDPYWSYGYVFSSGNEEVATNSYRVGQVINFVSSTKGIVGAADSGQHALTAWHVYSYGESGYNIASSYRGDSSLSGSSDANYSKNKCPEPVYGPVQNNMSMQCSK